MTLTIFVFTYLYAHLICTKDTVIYTFQFWFEISVRFVHKTYSSPLKSNEIYAKVLQRNKHIYTPYKGLRLGEKTM